jgi:hypothetical protein
MGRANGFAKGIRRPLESGGVKKDEPSKARPFPGIVIALAAKPAAVTIHQNSARNLASS